MVNEHVMIVQLTSSIEAVMALQIYFPTTANYPQRVNMFYLTSRVIVFKGILWTV